MNYLARMLTRARSLLASMPPSQRYSVIALFGVVVVSFMMLVSWGSREDYVPVLSELSGEHMTSIQVALDGSPIDYRFTNGALFVRRSDTDSVLMTLTEKDALPSDISSSFGFEDLVEPKNFSLETGDEQQMRFNIALGNMLARAISTAPEIQSAQVHIASSRDGYFGPEKATAAVSIRPRSAGRLPDKKLASICRLVAAAAGPKLAPADVVVADLVSGEAFSLDDGSSSFSKASDRIELQQMWNKYYREEIQKFLAPPLGIVQVLADVEIDTTSVETREKEYAVIHKTTSDTITAGPSTPAADTLTSPNVGVSPITSSASSSPASESHEKEETFAPSREVATEKPPGEPTDIKISVMADLERLTEIIRLKDPSISDEDAVTPERLAAECKIWEDRLHALPILREDTSKVSKVTFSAEPFAKLQVVSAASVVSVASTTRIIDALSANWQRFAMFALAVVALLMIRSLASRPLDDEPALAAAAADPAEDEIDLPQLKIDSAQKRAIKIRESIEDMVRRDPQAAVSLIRRWIGRDA